MFLTRTNIQPRHLIHKGSGDGGNTVTVGKIPHEQGLSLRLQQGEGRAGPDAEEDTKRISAKGVSRVPVGLLRRRGISVTKALRIRPQNRTEGRLHTETIEGVSNRPG